MLISFTIENAYSFRDKTTLDMKASPIKAHGYSLLEAGRQKLLPITAIYGANASGKSNLLFCLEMIKSSIRFASTFWISPFAFNRSSSANKYTRFQLRFMVNVGEDCDNWVECIYTTITLANDAAFKREELMCITASKRSSSLIYAREWNDDIKDWTLELGKSALAKTTIEEVKYVNEMEKDRHTLLLTALGRRARHMLFDNIYMWVNKVISYKDQPIPQIGMPFINENSDLVSFINSESTNRELQTFLQSINPFIKKIHLSDEKRRGDRKTEDNGYQLYVDYVVGNEVTDYSDVIISFFESKGVWTAMHLFPKIFNVLNSGGLLLVDELENSLHPLLMAKIINMFTSPETNPGKGQLIFTTHNVLLMDKKYFRQDEIVFTEKNESDGSSSLYRLSDIEGVRSDLDFCKNYILGAFGAIPDLSDKEGDGIYECEKGDPESQYSKVADLHRRYNRS